MHPASLAESQHPQGPASTGLLRHLSQQPLRRGAVAAAEVRETKTTNYIHIYTYIYRLKWLWVKNTGYPKSYTYWEKEKSWNIDQNLFPVGLLILTHCRMGNSSVSLVRKILEHQEYIKTCQNSLDPSLALQVQKILLFYLQRKAPRFWSFQKRLGSLVRMRRISRTSALGFRRPGFRNRSGIFEVYQYTMNQNDKQAINFMFDHEPFEVQHIERN